jgi:hypothetical protein
MDRIKRESPKNPGNPYHPVYPVPIPQYLTAKVGKNDTFRTLNLGWGMSTKMNSGKV